MAVIRRLNAQNVPSLGRRHARRLAGEWMRARAELHLRANLLRGRSFSTCPALLQLWVLGPSLPRRAIVEPTFAFASHFLDLDTPWGDSRRQALRDAWGPDDLSNDQGCRRGAALVVGILGDQGWSDVWRELQCLV